MEGKGRAQDVHIPPRTKGIKYAALYGNMRTMCARVARPKMAMKAYPAVREGL